MIGRVIPIDNHVVRTVGKEKWDWAQTNLGVTVAVASEVFLPRADYPPGTGPEECVSVDWLECFSGGLREQLNQVRDAVASRSWKVGRNAQFAVVVVDDVHQSAKKSGKSVDVRTVGEVDDPSHSGIYGLEPTDHIIAQEIARRAAAYPAYE